ncbi:hypothetical protein ATW55_07500 [Ferroacidibacillus organovorans]|uniref:SHS2 domain-containing protein n=2 Tax=Ferroacidibacillus organovorans TaxID=1765683 RepID=A0A117SYA8_9BACL|nr:hypothetical protein ATW55_07500 [Ferroacidibacillus organovorans]
MLPANWAVKNGIEDKVNKMGEWAYALDIGTRGVTGLLYVKTAQGIEIHAVETQEHHDRAMRDGQIHDVRAVAAVIQEVTRALENTSGVSLKKVSVAAAGRSLQTVTASATIPLLVPCKEEDLHQLHMVAIESAKAKWGFEARSHQKPTGLLHCVGYSVREYTLDGERMVNLIGQSGHEASVSLIATFLPRTVIESLDAALTHAGLMMRGLTLEPIAALHALVPSSMRNLNIALVDIGAGTSDVALTGNGSVRSYGMVPVAGDEITEALEQAYLLDFPVAERVKRSLDLDAIDVEDVLGQTRHLSSKKLLATLRPAVSDLAQKIADEIIRLNEKAPDALMLIGGGAKTPFLEKELSDKLGLPLDRIRVRDRVSIHQAKGCTETLYGPESVTPIGIALTAENSEITPITVRYDGRDHRLFAMRQMTVGDALTECGLDLRRLRARAGNALVVEVNEEIRSLPGSPGTQGIVQKNGIPCLLDDTLEAGDTLSVAVGEDGKDAFGTIADVLTISPISMTVNGTVQRVLPRILKNGRVATPHSKLSDRDVIVTKWPTISEWVGTIIGRNVVERIAVVVDEKPLELQWQTMLIEPQFSWDETIVEGLAFSLKGATSAPPTVHDALCAAGYRAGEGISVLVNGIRREIPLIERILKNGAPCDLKAPLEQGDVITTEGRQETPPTMSTMVLLLSETLRAGVRGRERLVMKINGEEAEFTSPVAHGDEVEVYYIPWN